MNHTAAILIVDDEPSNFDVIEALLFKEGYQLYYASNGVKALKILEKLQLDLIILDVMMPEIDGLEVCRQVKANSQLQHIPIIMVTALNSKEDLAHCLETGADDFIGKPVNGIELRARVRSMLRIKQQYDKLTANLKLREDLSEMIVHDLRNPLTNIILASEYLKLTSLKAKQEEKVEQIRMAGDRLQSLTNDLLILAKAEAGKMTLNRESVDLCALAQKVRGEMKAIALQKKIKLLAHLPPGKHLFLDANLFERVLENLLSNGIKFSPSGSTITLQINYPANKLAQIIVADQGPGISAQIKNIIFQKYEVGEIKNGTAQTGIGLAFCKMVIEAHNGEIFVEDNHPRGAVFTINLFGDN
ncbi:MAG: hybrid sensor histidine kinase/response regulator [Gomphosphaeria aponina SAG 52.96 = DSM 107014]|uniref:histidine kinase n=1 Tax=Gomphosphaeria aponina SAG 52.96 = DSM 107014 TaxID=1521640 RepID=A0A941JUH0_9CHRO|nr:hybrid sensor histidine kinase/response regulator [Gomphosphaeria aponina SAG 52.96 = DSM 107014]